MKSQHDVRGEERAARKHGKRAFRDAIRAEFDAMEDHFAVELGRCMYSYDPDFAEGVLWSAERKRLERM